MTGGGGRRRGDGELDRLAGLGLEEEHDPHLRGRARTRAGWESVEDAGQNAWSKYWSKHDQYLNTGQNMTSI